MRSFVILRTYDWTIEIYDAMKTLVFVPPPPQNGAGEMEMPGVRPLVRPSEICCKRSKIVDELISNLHTSIRLGISSLSLKLG
jgi:hypothetical protein